MWGNYEESQRYKGSQRESWVEYQAVGRPSWGAIQDYSGVECWAHGSARVDSTYYSGRDREKDGSRMKCEKSVNCMDPNILRPLLKENDDSRYDKQIRTRLKFQKDLAGYVI